LVSVSCVVCCTGRGLCCVGLISRPEESYRVWCVWVCSWSLDNGGGAPAHSGLLHRGGKISHYFKMSLTSRSAPVWGITQR
jgi:hypothetical protein